LRHFTDPQFWETYQHLPASIRRLADRSFQTLQKDPTHPSLRLKPVGRYWSVRVGIHYRALAVKDGDDMIWFWIGTHSKYDQITR
jgi:hypothetical protein